LSDTTPEDPAHSDIAPVGLEEEMRRSYLDYAMSVIVSRALPDARDGLKPVHRRILFAMHEAGNTADKAHRKSARVVGDVMGKYHPHGDSAIYDAMVRMAQPFSMRVPLIDGQGNFGSMDGDAPAAMRYTEVRLARSAAALLAGIEEDTVDFVPNYDESAEEPRVLPASYPNLLVNGAGGIAVGMATNIPTHNPGEVIDATLKLIEAPETSLEELMRIIPGPDFPTGGLILGRSGIRNAFETGRGSIPLRARAAIEEMRGGRSMIVVSEIPYQVNKATLIEKIAELVRAKAVEGISDLRDESDRDGLRIVIELKKDATPEVVLNQLYRFTQLQTSFGVNFVALDEGKPKQMGLRDALLAFIKFREEVITRRSRFRLEKARDRGHTLIGLAVAVANIDEVIALIRAAPDANAARVALMARDWPAADIGPLLALVDDPRNVLTPDGTVRLTEDQAKGILELRLQRLTGLEREKIAAELGEVGATIRELLEILASRPRRLELMAQELLAVRATIATPAHDRDRGRRRRPGRREPDRARHDGRHPHARRLCEAHRARRLPRAEPRRPRPHRRRTARGRHRGAQLRRAHPPMGAVLHQPRHRLPREDLAAPPRAARRGAGAASARCCSSSRTRPSPPCCRCRRTRRCGRTCTSSSPPPAAMSGATS
jgi:DNA gyrase subunit A